MTFLNQTKGQITSRDLVITGIITLLVAAIMVTIFIVLGGRSSQESLDSQTQDLINQIKQQAIQEQQKQDAISEGGDEGVKETTISGVLSGINGKTLVIIDDATSAPTPILLTEKTIAVYNGSVFSQADFYTGDLLTVRAIKNRNTWEAVSITVRFSAAPNTAAPVPEQLQQRPDGTLQPIGN